MISSEMNVMFLDLSCFCVPVSTPYTPVGSIYCNRIIYRTIIQSTNLALAVLSHSARCNLSLAEHASLNGESRCQLVPAVSVTVNDPMLFTDSTRRRLESIGSEPYCQRAFLMLLLLMMVVLLLLVLIPMMYNPSYKGDWSLFERRFWMKWINAGTVSWNRSLFPCNMNFQIIYICL